MKKKITQTTKILKNKRKIKRNISGKKTEGTLSKKEEKVLVAEMLAVLCRIIMNYQVYSFGKEVMLQEGYGCIGDKAIGFIALLVMIWWANNLKKKLEEVKIANDLLKIFVDDVNTIVSPIKAGFEYIDGKLVFNETKQEEDKNVPDDERTMKIVQKIANDNCGMNCCNRKLLWGYCY